MAVRNRKGYVPSISNRKARQTRHAIASHLGVHSTKCPMTYQDNTKGGNPVYAGEHHVQTPEPIVPGMVQGIPGCVEIATGGRNIYRLLPSS